VVTGEEVVHPIHRNVWLRSSWMGIAAIVLSGCAQFGYDHVEVKAGIEDPWFGLFLGVDITLGEAIRGEPYASDPFSDLRSLVDDILLDSGQGKAGGSRCSQGIGEAQGEGR